MSSLLGLNTSTGTATESSLIHEQPLYSKEETDEVHKKRTSLEMEVQTLEQQLKARREQVKESKGKAVSPGELSMIKAEARESISESNSSQLSQIVNNFQDVIKKTCELAAQNYTLSQQIQEEEMDRLNRIDEYDIIESAFDFSDLRAKVPRINSITKEIPKVDQLDFDRFSNNLKTSQTEYTKLSFDVGPTPKQLELANEIVKGTEPRIELGKLGTSVERAENQRLELLLQQSDSIIRNMEMQNELLRRKISGIELETNNIGIAGKAQATANDTSFKNSMNAIEHEIQTIKDKIDASADRYDTLCQQIEKLQVVEVEHESSDAFEEEEEVTNFDFNDDYSQQEIMEDELMRQKAELVKEIGEMKQKYNETKRLATERESLRTKDIKATYAKYQKNKALIQQERSRISSPSSSKSSGVSLNLRNVLDRIDSSIEEANSLID